MLQTMHLKAHALEHDFGAGGMRDLLDDSGRLIWVQSRRRHQDVELSREKPQRGNIVLASLERERQ